MAKRKDTVLDIGDLHFLAALPGEPEKLLRKLIAFRVAEFAPRNSVERQLVHQMTLAEWCKLRALAMTRAVHQDIAAVPPSTSTPADSLACFAQYANAWAGDPFAPVLAALVRLDLAATRCYDAGVRRLIALRRCGPDFFPPAAGPLTGLLNQYRTPIQNKEHFNENPQ